MMSMRLSNYWQIVRQRPLWAPTGDTQELHTEWEHSEFIAECLQWHNAFRARHGAPPLQLCPQWRGAVAGQEVASYWYSACRQYNYDKEPDVLHANVNAGHSTQLVWARCRLLGLGKARSRAGKVLVVAHYRPPGNVSGAFQSNVALPLPECSSTRSSRSTSPQPQAPPQPLC
ncbi:Golgi-associated plant pathogenesis-related protein 1 [Gryllus bimaculatus]|nr:Golgi-associated plant pathogenesis-related protein 1 [Gryllus bimaculatus]